MPSILHDTAAGQLDTVKAYYNMIRNLKYEKNRVSFSI